MQEAKQRGFPAPVWPDQSHAHACGDDEVKVFEQRAFADSKAHLPHFDQALGLAIRGGEIDLGGRAACPRIHVRQFADEILRFVYAGLRLRGARLGAVPQPLDLVAHAIFQRFLPLRLRLQKFFLLLQKGAVVSVDAKNALRIKAVQLDHRGCGVFQKIAVVTDDDAGEPGALQQSFEPLDAGQIEMVRRLVQQQNVRLLRQGFGNHEAFAPATRERRGFHLEVVESHAAKRLGNPALPFRVRHAGRLQSALNGRADALARGKLRLLRNVAEAGKLADGYLTAVRRHAPDQNLQQRRFTRAIWPDQADAIAFGDGKADVLEQGRCSKCLRDALSIEDGRQREP